MTGLSRAGALSRQRLRWREVGERRAVAGAVDGVGEEVGDVGHHGRQRAGLRALLRGQGERDHHVVLVPDVEGVLSGVGEDGGHVGWSAGTVLLGVIVDRAEDTVCEREKERETC